MTLKARGCSIFCGTISATVVLRMPTVPLLAPAIDLANMAINSERENPKSRDAVMVHISPSIITGFRPKQSEARPQITPVTHWLSEKLAEVIPAWGKGSAKSGYRVRPFTHPFRDLVLGHIEALNHLRLILCQTDPFHLRLGWTYQIWKDRGQCHYTSLEIVGYCHITHDVPGSANRHMARHHQCL